MSCGQHPHAPLCLFRTGRSAVREGLRRKSASEGALLGSSCPNVVPAIASQPVPCGLAGPRADRQATLRPGRGGTGRQASGRPPDLLDLPRNAQVRSSNLLSSPSSGGRFRGGASPLHPILARKSCNRFAFPGGARQYAGREAAPGSVLRSQSDSSTMPVAGWTARNRKERTISCAL